MNRHQAERVSSQPEKKPVVFQRDADSQNAKRAEHARQEEQESVMENL